MDLAGFRRARGRRSFIEQQPAQGAQVVEQTTAGAEMLFQLRDDKTEIVERLEALLRKTAVEISTLNGCAVEVERIRTGLHLLPLRAADRETPARFRCWQMDGQILATRRYLPPYAVQVSAQDVNL